MNATTTTKRALKSNIKVLSAAAMVANEAEHAAIQAQMWRLVDQLRAMG